MRNTTNPNGPDASYVNGRPADRSAQRGAERKRTAPVTRALPNERASAAPASREQKTSSSASSHSSSSSRSSHHSSHRRRKSKLRNIMKNYGPTIAAVVGIVVLAAAVILITSLGNKKDEEESTAYVPPTDSIVLDSDLVTLDASEVDGKVSIPTSSVYGEDGKAYVVLKRDGDGNVSGAVYSEYLDNGTLICEREYDAYGFLLTKTVFTASEKNCVKSVFTTKTDKNGVYDGHVLEEIDADGVTLKRTEYTVTGVVDNYTYPEYDEEGRVKKESVYSAYGVITGYNEYLYDDRDRVTDKFQYDQNYIAIYRTSWEYDDSDRVIKESFYIKDLCRSYNEYEYRENGTYKMTTYTLTDERTMTYDKKVMVE